MKTPLTPRAGLVTLVVVAAALALTQVMLPTIDGRVASFLFPGAAAKEGVSIALLGLTPVIWGLLLVEALRLAVPPWRPDRITPPTDRALTAVGVGLSALFALAQSFFIAKWFQLPIPRIGTLAIDPGTASVWLSTLTICGGVCVLLGLAYVVERHGIGHGYGLLVVGVLPKLGLIAWGAAAGHLPTQSDVVQLVSLGLAATFVGAMRYARLRPTTPA